MERKSPIPNDGKQTKQIEILNLLRARGPQPRIEISSHIQLTKAAVTRLVNDMLRAGCLTERGEVQGEDLPHRRGRRKIMLDINENYRLVFGIVVERNRLQVGLTNLKGQALSHIEADVSGCSYRDLLERITAQVNLIIKDNCIPPGLILGGGICLSTREKSPARDVSADERLARIRMDLSHALNFPLLSVSTCMGALVAQQLFSGHVAGDILLLRVGETCGCAVMTNGQIYRGFTRQAGGFVRALDRALPLPEGFAGLRGQPGLADGSHSALNECLREIIANCAAVLDPECIVAFGDYMETEFAIPRLNSGGDASAPASWRVTPAVVTEHTTFLAGCAAVIARYFYQMSP